MISLENCKLLSSVFCFLILNSFVSSRELPAVLRDLRCSASRDYNTCYINNGNKAIPLLARGDPEYGIPKMMPLVIPYVNLISTPTLHIELRNVEIHGLDKLRITSHSGSVKLGTVTADFTAKNLTIVGDYEAKGRISIMPIDGKGRFSIYLENGEYKTVNSVKIIEKDGEKYADLSNSHFGVKLGKIVFNLENLFEGNKQLGDQLNNFLNENWEILLEDFRPGIEKTITGQINEILDNVSKNVPLKNIFLP